MSKKNVPTKFLIIGQGIAGSCLALELRKRGLSFKIVDNGHKTSASSIAAGLVNPITGRRFVKSWMIDELLPYALGMYGDYQDAFDLKIVNKLPIYRSLKSAAEENEWISRMTLPGWEKYMEWTGDQRIKGVENNYSSVGIINIGFVVNIPILLKGVSDELKGGGQFIYQQFDYEELIYENHFWHFAGQSYEHIIFCEGAQIKFNKYFGHLPFSPAKGECMLIKSEYLVKDVISISNVTIIPQTDDTFWAGSTYEWDFEDGRPSRSKYEDLDNRLKSVITDPYTVKSHSAAIRPSSDDRRPMLGQHGQYKGLYVFNGLGTKGASLAPYFANHLVEHICDHKTLMPEVDIVRWQRLNKS